ncbi:P-loop containing nucleoside triphosphate hydrolase protein [Lentinula raphanica]|nr:P-loop containing nucleoside triphosphate hydrolase protein [Lentinula raphanica]KAJ3765752.1 P-loop containing nucleoside triphosphate hydrolase protein [Lentinula raphanica]
MSSVPAFSFESEQGLKLLREGTRDLLPYDPHDVSIEALASILDRKDVLELKLKKCGIEAVALNSDVLIAAQNNNSTLTLWQGVHNSQVLLMSPELLHNDSIHKQLAMSGDSASSFKERCAVLIVDEAHLIYEWGRSFREAYRYIGELRVQLNNSVRVLALTATLREDGPLTYVLKTFGLREGQYVDIHRSNLRPEIRVTTSLLESSLSTADDFPELRWTVNPVLTGITIIFTPDRFSALRITLYLRRCNDYLANKDLIRKWDSLNESVLNTETREMITAMDPETDRLIIVSTTILMVGVDFQGVKRIVNLEPDDFDKELQMEGRMRGSGECYVYFSKHTMEEARKMLEKEKNAAAEHEEHVMKKSKKLDNQSGKKKKPPMDIQFAKRIISHCRTPIQNTVYNNPPFGQNLCSCRDCSAQPRLSTFVCICGGCHKGESQRDRIDKLQELATSAVSQRSRLKVTPGHTLYLRIPAMPHPSTSKQPLSSIEKEIITYHLNNLDSELFAKGIGNDHGAYLPGMFVRPPVISNILHNFCDIQDSKEKLALCLSKHDLVPEWLDAIWESLNADIKPALEDDMKRRSAQVLQQKREVEEAKKIKELMAIKPEDFDRFLTYSPTLEEANGTGFGVKRHEVHGG